MFHTGFPQLLGGLVSGQLEADGRLVVLEFTGTNFDEECLTLVGDFEDFRPSEAVDAKSVELEESDIN